MRARLTPKSERPTREAERKWIRPASASMKNSTSSTKRNSRLRRLDVQIVVGLGNDGHPRHGGHGRLDPLDRRFGCVLQRNRLDAMKLLEGLRRDAVGRRRAGGEAAVGDTEIRRTLGHQAQHRQSGNRQQENRGKQQDPDTSCASSRRHFSAAARLRYRLGPVDALSIQRRQRRLAHARCAPAAAARRPGRGLRSGCASRAGSVTPVWCCTLRRS